MHAVYMSLGNIHKETRNKISRRAWVLLAKLPTPNFSSLNAQTFGSEEERERMPGILKANLFHACMRKVLEPLRKNEIHDVVDPTGARRRCVAVLMAWIADLEEQYLIAGLAKNACPPCKANFDTLGIDHIQLPRTGNEILQTLRQLRQQYPSADTWQFYNLAKAYDLLGVEAPCWEGLAVNICRIICVDLLHGVHKMFADHVLKWLTATIGKEELDKRFIVQPKRVGSRTFSGGISKISQWSGRENRDLERHVLAVITGDENVTPRILKAVRALLDFMYKAQFPMHSDKTLESMRADLQVFWDNVDAFRDNGARAMEHFNIPKLHALHHYVKNIQNLGTADNYSTEIGETLHIPMCKAAYRATNHKSYSQQIIRYLTRQESLHLYGAYLSWRDAMYPDHLDIRSDDNDSDDDDESDDSSSDGEVDGEHNNGEESVSTSGGFSIGLQPKATSIEVCSA